VTDLALDTIAGASLQQHLATDIRRHITASCNAVSAALQQCTGPGGVKLPGCFCAAAQDTVMVQAQWPWRLVQAPQISVVSAFA